MKTQLIQSMGSFILGTGATLTVLASWLGTTDLQAIKDSVQNYVIQSEQHSFALAQDYQVTVENANAEIGEYKVALEQANSNIDKLITAYEDKVDEMEQAQASAEQDLKDLQQALADMETRLDSQYKTDMNKVIEQANAQINQANQEVANTRQEVELNISLSQVDEYVEQAKQLKDQLDTGNDKTVTDISSIVPSEQPQE